MVQDPIPGKASFPRNYFLRPSFDRLTLCGITHQIFHHKLHLRNQGQITQRTYKLLPELILVR